MISKRDLSVLRTIIDYSIEENAEWIDTNTIAENLQEKGVSEEDFYGSLEVLAGGYLKAHRSGGRTSNVTVEPYGFQVYAQEFEPGFNEEKFRVIMLRAIQRYNDEVSSKQLAADLDKPNLFIAYFLDVLAQRQDIRTRKDQFVGNIVSEILERGKRGARGESQ